jgi:hypothetical protein
MNNSVLMIRIIHFPFQYLNVLIPSNLTLIPFNSTLIPFNLTLIPFNLTLIPFNIEYVILFLDTLAS